MSLPEVSKKEADGTGESEPEIIRDALREGLEREQVLLSKPRVKGVG